MALLAFIKSTGEVIPDFQGLATAEGLTENAIKRGIDAKDIEIRDVDEAEFAALEDSLFAEARLEAVKEQAALDARADELQVRLALTNADLEALRHLLNRL